MELLKEMKSLVRKIYSFFLYYYYCIRNKRVDYLDYRKVSRNFPIFSMCSQLGIIGNKCYGNNRAVKNKLGKAFDKKCMIEHGIYFGGFVIEEECLMKNITTIYTYSPYRLEAIKKCLPHLNKKVIVVGPYILYAAHFHSPEKRAQLKKNYGRILLVFPSHPFPGQPTEYNVDLFLSEIEKIASSFDTVFISLYWLDIKNGLHTRYEEKGYKIVCSGSRSDPYFLSRQKDLIELADMTMSNDLGTHIGYCIALNRPHYLYKQPVYTQLNKTQLNTNGFEAQLQKEGEFFYTLFGEYREEITEEQRKVVEYYWGCE